MAVDDSTRERVRALVREVLDRASADDLAAPGEVPQRVVVNSLRERTEREYERDESAKTLLTEDDLRGLEPGARVRVADGVKFTPLAADIIRERSIELIKKPGRRPTVKVRSVAIGCDHGGFAAKEMLREHLAGIGLLVRDFGTDSEEAVDYPDFAHAVARAVAAGQADAGIIIDGAGIGSAMTANKVPGIRAAACYSEALAKNSREHNGANVLTLGSGQNSADEMIRITETFLSTSISEPRHKRRVAKIDNIEKQYKRQH